MVDMRGKEGLVVSGGGSRGDGGVGTVRLFRCYATWSR